MTDEATLLSTILARPDDDLPRQVMADWLDETAGSVECTRCVGKGRFKRKYIMQPTGDSHTTGELSCPTCHGTGAVSDGHTERAEFIRVQCELATLIGNGSRCAVCHWPIRPGEGCEPDNCCFRPGEHSSEYPGWFKRQTHFHALRRRERELWAGSAGIEFAQFAVQFNVIARLSSHEGFSHEAICRRGFIESVAMPWSGFRAHADAIRKATPLRKVRTDMPDEERRKCWTFNPPHAETFFRHPDYKGIEFELPQQEGDTLVTFNIPVRNPRHSFVMRAE